VPVGALALAPESDIVSADQGPSRAVYGFSLAENRRREK